VRHTGTTCLRQRPGTTLLSSIEWVLCLFAQQKSSEHQPKPIGVPIKLNLLLWDSRMERHHLENTKEKRMVG
jgi:hypothetical protein